MNQKTNKHKLVCEGYPGKTKMINRQHQSGKAFSTKKSQNLSTTATAGLANMPMHALIMVSATPTLHDHNGPAPQPDHWSTVPTAPNNFSCMQFPKLMPWIQRNNHVFAQVRGLH